MGNDNSETGAAFIENARQTLQKCFKQIEHCFGQISEEDAWWRPFDSANSLGNIVLHLCGNIGQWIISGVGGAPDMRKRPAEFAQREPIPKAELLRRLRETVAAADEALAKCSADDLL